MSHYKITITLGEAAKQHTQAIACLTDKNLMPVNPAAEAIHSQAGKILELERNSLLYVKSKGDFQCSQAILSEGFGMNVQHILHVIAPATKEKKASLDTWRNAYVNSMTVAQQAGIRALAFASFQLGDSAQAVEEVAKNALLSIGSFLDEHEDFEEVMFVLENEMEYEVFTRINNQLFQEKYKTAVVKNSLVRIVFEEDGSLHHIVSTLEDSKGCINLSFPENWKNVHVYPFTELADISGNEIFEGDKVVRVSQPVGNPSTCEASEYVVYSKNGSFFIGEDIPLTKDTITEMSLSIAS